VRLLLGALEQRRERMHCRCNGALLTTPYEETTVEQEQEGTRDRKREGEEKRRREEEKSEIGELNEKPGSPRFRSRPLSDVYDNAYIVISCVLAS
jgi:hypothetical protein